ncbi:polysaccharide pyruvyl transferase family protein [Phenylobacterium kunshanense]|uniref:polysaccharide pyruvyl transferase family protein n=1 Tax=Phenylobacterium kunshanense TaxID=1445034 RepID=UPI001402584F|nr:polysaccharide pyruvyl transferase family protein [Phenylobacterium kunshanense]
MLDIGGGDSFTDIYGPKRFGFLWLSKMMATARGKPLILSPQTIGPFTRQPQTFLASIAMTHARTVVARDPISFDVARKMAPRANVLQAVDVAFALPFERRSHNDGGKTEVGVNVSGLLFNGGYSGANEFGMQIDYADYTRKLLAALSARSDVAVRLLCHVNSDALPQDDDGRVAAKLAEAFPSVILVPKFASPSEAKSYISGLDFLVSGRMHACIAAFSSGVPVVPVAYSRKFAGLFEGVLSYPHLVPVKGLDTDEAVEFTLRKLDDRDAMKGDIARGSAGVEALLDRYRGELAEVFSLAVSK